MPGPPGMAIRPRRLADFRVYRLPDIALVLTCRRTACMSLRARTSAHAMGGNVAKIPVRCRDNGADPRGEFRIRWCPERGTDGCARSAEVRGAGEDHHR